MERRGFIAVVDDDESVRESLPDLIGVLGHQALPFSSAEEFLESGLIDQAKCLVLDIAMPKMSGIELQKELVRQGITIPIVFITAHGDDTICNKLRKPGLVECLIKPFTDTALLIALNGVMKY